MITTHLIKDSKENTIGTTVIVDGESMLKFAELIQRGANLWPDAPSEIKEFADLITNGKVMQDYKAQAGTKEIGKWIAVSRDTKSSYHPYGFDTLMANPPNFRKD